MGVAVTLRSRVIALFPALMVAGALALLGAAIATRRLELAGAALLWIYLVPVAIYRLHEAIWPVKIGGSYLVGGEYSAWWGGHQIQLVYYAFPWLEAALRLVPGAYSAWLRLWGSKVGRGVYWTPAVEIGDRALMEIGDGAVFGHRVAAFSHIIKPRRTNVLLVVRRVTVGSGAFVGAGVVLAPGAVVAPGAFVEAGTHVYPGEHVEADA